MTKFSLKDLLISLKEAFSIMFQRCRKKLITYKFQSKIIIFKFSSVLNVLAVRRMQKLMRTILNGGFLVRGLAQRPDLKFPTRRVF